MEATPTAEETTVAAVPASPTSGEAGQQDPNISDPPRPELKGPPKVPLYKHLCSGVSWSSYIRCAVLDQPNEALGFIVYHALRTPMLLVTSAFVLPYLLQVAKLNISDESIDGKVNWLGSKFVPSSYSTVFSLITTFMVFLTSPFIGAIMDYTYYRREVSIVFTWISIVFGILHLALISPNAWWLGGLLIIIRNFFIEHVSTLVNAYLPEISNSPVHRAKISAQGIVCSNLAQVLFALVCILILVGAEGPSVRLENSTFEDSDSLKSFNVRIGTAANVLDVAPSFSFNVSDPYVGSCESQTAYCSLTTSEVYQGDSALIAKNGLSEPATQVSLFYTKEFVEPEAFQGRLLVFSAFFKKYTDDVDVLLQLRIWQDDVLTTSKFIPLDSTFKYNQIRTTISETATSLSFEVIASVSESSSATSSANLGFIIDSAEVVQAPRAFAPIYSFFSIVLFGFGVMIAFSNLGHRKPAHSKPQDKSIYAASLSRLGNTLVSFRNENKQELLFLISLSFYASTYFGALSSASIVMTELFKASSSIVGAALLVAQLCGIFGAIFFFILGKKIGFVRSLISNLLLFLVVAGTVYGFVKDENDLPLIWLVAALLGFCNGGGFALYRAIFSTMTPVRQEAEFNGLYTFFFFLLSWTGLLLFTLINEATSNIRLAFASFSLFNVIAVIFLMFVSEPVERKINTTSVAVGDDSQHQQAIPGQGSL